MGIEKYIFHFAVTLLFFASLSFAQQKNDTTAVKTKEKSGCITLGVLQGGGSLIGIDIESPLSRRVSMQYGAGFFGLGASICYHFKPDIMRSFLSLAYWHQGWFRSMYVQSVLGPTYVFRAKNIFTFQIGAGYVIDKGPLYEEAYKNKKQYSVMLLYSVGVFDIL